MHWSSILMAARSQEVRLATWDEFDLQNAMWAAPAGHMKMRREHKVPLSPEAVAVLKSAAARLADTNLVLPAQAAERCPTRCCSPCFAG